MQAHRLDLHHDQHQDDQHQKAHLQCRAILGPELRSVADEQAPLVLGQSRDKTVRQLAPANQQQLVLVPSRLLQFDRCENFQMHQATQSDDLFARIRALNHPDQVASNDQQELHQTRCVQSEPDTCRPSMLHSFRGSSTHRSLLSQGIRRRGQ
ncbi:unannotated protein [freshwater metagenome]|uniref:Unannotated protein n=1 Tax=freshwater metagenome TaxID=449393 RepID=A0A6J6XT90_9ZZZZ